MDKKVDDFLDISSNWFDVDKDLLFNTDFRLSNAIARIMGFGFYIVDYVNNTVLYISDNITRWCGLSPDKSGVDHIDCYLRLVPDSDYQMLIEINSAVFSFFKDKKDNEILKYIVSYNFHLNGILRHQYFTPIAVKNGFVVRGLFILTLPSENTLGHIVIRNEDLDFFYEYSLTNHVWHKKNLVKLSDDEKMILWYSAQGHTTDSVANLLCKSPDTIKKNKKKIFKKLNVSNISNALIYAINNKLL